MPVTIANGIPTPIPTFTPVLSPSLATITVWLEVALEVGVAVVATVVLVEMRLVAVEELVYVEEIGVVDVKLATYVVVVFGEALMIKLSLVPAGSASPSTNISK